MTDHTAQAFWRYSNKNGETGFGWLCPGCGTNHAVPVTGPRAWRWDGNEETPTFRPSVRVSFTDCEALYAAAGDGPITDELRARHPPKPMICHFFIRSGIAHFCGDCTHEHAGKVLPVEPDGDDP